MKHIRKLSLSLLISLLLGFIPLFPAHADVYGVNSVNDVDDGTCDATHCSLREAIKAAEAHPGPDEVRFNISGCGGVCLIQPTSPLPTLASGGTTITGYTMAGATEPGENTAANLLIRIDGALVPSTVDNGFSITSADNVIEGLIITRFSAYGVAIFGASATGNEVTGNIIGTDGADTTGLGNLGGVGLADGAHDNTIGGDQYIERNVISGNTINGVDVQPFPGTPAYDNTISGNFIGTTNLGNAALANGVTGLQLGYGTSGNMVGGTITAERNVISGNASDGVVIWRPLTNANTLHNNYIGTARSGLAAVPNGGSGVSIYSESDNNVIGGTGSDERNVISGNATNGVRIYGSGTTGNTVAGNYIGTKSNGTEALANGSYGVLLTESTSGNMIGGATSSAGNLISGNFSSGVNITNSASGNTISGNRIGTSSSGYNALPNGGNGIMMSSGANGNTIGGDTVAERNTISANTLNGVVLTGAAATGNTITGNRIGTSPDGLTAFPNGGSGIVIETGARGNTVGGLTASERNMISGNDDNGVVITGAGSNDNLVSGNYIGIDANGVLALPNQSYGVIIQSGAASNTIGPANIISGNGQDGVYLTNSAAGNSVIGNLIGTNYLGTGPVGNIAGVEIDGDAINNVIGGDDPGERNIISGNETGVRIQDTGTTGNQVIGNYIGTNSSGDGTLANDYGVSISLGAQSNIIGEAGAGNLISGNLYTGIVLAGSATSGNTIAANYIGINAAGTADLGNQDYGIHIQSGAHTNTMGGTSAADRNVISGNAVYGVWIEGSGSDGNTLSANFIGTDSLGIGDLGNGSDGVRIASGAADNVVGGDMAGERNVISANGGFGVLITGSGTDGNTVASSYIGTDVTGTLALENTNGGVAIQEGAQSNTVGGDTVSERNVISGNDGPGVELSSSGTSGNTVSGNYIGLGSDGLTELGNYTYGVIVQLDAGSNMIGGYGADEGNVISGNENAGVGINNSSGNTVVGNLIGVAADGVTPKGNHTDGVRILNGATDNIIGPGNRVAYNAFTGVSVDGITSIGNVITQNLIYENLSPYEIRLLSGANGGITLAFVNSVTGFPITLSGTACAGCTAEIFANPVDDEAGRIYLGSAVADGGGNWSLVVGAIPAPYLTATATDASDGTSMFSSYTHYSEILSLFLPLIAR